MLFEMHITSGVLEWTFSRSRQSTYATVSNPMSNDVRLASHTQPFLDISKLAMLCISNVMYLPQRAGY